jgi:hypothetical protein
MQGQLPIYAKMAGKTHILRRMLYSTTYLPITYLGSDSLTGILQISGASTFSQLAGR